MSIAQSLYEKKVTTYPRTDARVLSSAVANEISKNLSGLRNIEEYEKYVGIIEQNHYSLKDKYVNDSKITDHYAIIPTGRHANDLTQRETKVYEMIVRRFLAAFYPPAEFEIIKFNAYAND